MSELVVIATHARAMSITVGTHKIHGRVVLLRSTAGFVIIADRLETHRILYDENHVLRAVPRWIGQAAVPWAEPAES